VKESKGRDIRVIVVGGRVIASMRRIAKAGEFRSNLHRGGRGDRVQLTRAYRSVAIRAAKAMGLEVAGVDMLEARNGPKILEINSSPGLEGVERASGVDVAAAIIQHAERYAASEKNVTRATLDQRILEVIQDERMPLARTTPARGARAGKAAS